MPKALEIAILVLVPLAYGVAVEYLFERIRQWRACRRLDRGP